MAEPQPTNTKNGRKQKDDPRKKHVKAFECHIGRRLVSPIMAAIRLSNGLRPRKACQ